MFNEVRYIMELLVMKKVVIVGHIDHGKSTLDSAIKNVLEYKNPYAFLNDKPHPSKSRLKKCEKGLHEYSETNQTEKTELGTRKLWACIHCGKIMNQ